MSGLFAALSVSAAGWVGLLAAGLVLAAAAYWLSQRRAVEPAHRDTSQLVEKALAMVESSPKPVDRGLSPIDEVARARAAKTPVRPVATPPVEPPAPGRLAGVRVLAVDDDGDWREILSRILATAGAEARLAASAAEALRLFDGWRPDVVLSDLAMPGIDGYALSDAIAPRGGGAGRPVPMVAMSAHGSAHERIRTARAGFVAHLTKPVLADELIRTLGRAAAGPAQGAREARRVV